MYEILVIGSGGREHAIAWALAKDKRVATVYVAPGNGGTFTEPKVKNIPLHSFQELTDFARNRNIHLTIVGPEAPLSQGIVDKFNSENLPIFGPTKNAAQLESSKEFAKAFMQRHNIPTARYMVFTDPALAHEHVNKNVDIPIVIKADGLAAGKGVVIAQTLKEAHVTIDMMLIDGKMGSAGSKIIIEEFLQGEEVSFIVAVDGTNVLPLATSQDYKKLLDGDNGPNTGGMGAFSPAGKVFNEQLQNKVMANVISPTISGLKKEGIIYKGFLYAGLIIAEDSTPRVLEYNCRLGDPETQPILFRLKSSFLNLIEHGINQSLSLYDINWDSRCAISSVIAAQGYPGNPLTGTRITDIPPNQPGIHLFHAGTENKDGGLRVNGGRIICVTALGNDISHARAKVYDHLEKIDIPGSQFRKDIGLRMKQP